MSVLNQSGEEQVECPLCMEPLEVDDLNFFPCTCGYQICRFCWHRIRLDENGGLCPACRKAYSENPADFIPLSQEEVAKLKAEKRQRDQQRKAKLTESRKHLASVRVVQRNLVFVVGLPPRLAEAEILKRHEYFGKFGKIHKVVINQSTSYAGSQGPSASAYVTYMKSDDALRAIQAVNNVTIDNRVIKSSLGTTKYCSHFMKNQPCPKPDCMYLHEYDPEASFTKEQMHSGKHQEYEKKLHDELQLRSKHAGSGGAAATTGGGNATAAPAETKNGHQVNGAATHKGQKDGAATSNGGNGSSNKDPSCPHQEKEKGRKGKTKEGRKEKRDANAGKNGENKPQTGPPGNQSVKIEVKDVAEPDTSSGPSSEATPSSSPPRHQSPPFTVSAVGAAAAVEAIATLSAPSDDNTSFFSSSDAFHKLHASLMATSDAISDKAERGAEEERHSERGSKGGTQMLTDSLPAIRTTEDWAAAFGFVGHQNRDHDHSQQQQHKLQQRDVSKLSAFGGFGPLGGQDSEFGKGIDSYGGFYEISKMQENLMDALANKTSAGDGLGVGKLNGFSARATEPAQPHHATHTASNGLDHSMLKFMSDFHKTNANKEQPPFQNGFNGIGSYHQGLLLQQKHIEEQLMNLGLKQNYGDSHTGAYQNGLGAYLNRESSMLNGGLGGIHSLFAKKTHQTAPAPQQHHHHHHQLNSRNSEAELDFDPFQETQKALAEMMASEQNHKSHNSSGHSNQINGIVYNQNGSHMPPPPPGFVHQQQSSSHMNSFGSKILPYLNMSSSQQQIGNSTSWPTSFSGTPLQQQKSLANNTCNDWKVLDPAILSASSRNYQMAPPLRDQSGPQQQQQQRSYDSTSAFSAYAQLQPSNFNSFAHPTLWYGNDLNAQISSPPGFRNSQTSKQQEC
ncbi:uncharacterized protein LOC132706675 isoform X2 [Cylas formicarius]|uniref:uncharacterized protein LOC132706675 isoform X2 n=1 Tax=Cylas formicarius TaxID=197179 RepID=UPI002958DBDE|nr:uncharacterized protein LOC132706675 isoform X2 [Cylas formicarius]